MAVSRLTGYGNRGRSTGLETNELGGRKKERGGESRRRRLALHAPADGEKRGKRRHCV